MWRLTNDAKVQSILMPQESPKPKVDEEEDKAEETLKKAKVVPTSPLKPALKKGSRKE
jgi:hypothetical protein